MFVNEPESNVENIIFRFRVDGEIVEYPFEFGFYMPYIPKSGTTVLERQLTRQLKPGFVEVDEIRIINSHGLSTVLFNEKFYSESVNKTNLDHLAFTLIGDDYDLDAPVLESILIDKNTLGPNDVLNIEISAYDSGSGVRSAFVQFKNTTDTYSLGRYLYTRLTPNSEGKLTGSLTIDPFTQPGNYVIYFIFISDFASNYAWLDPLNSYSDNDWSRFYYLEQSFTVVGTQLDDILPTLSDFTLNRQEALIGETIEATVDAFDEPSGIQHISIGYRNGNIGFELYGFAPSNPTDPYIVQSTISNYVPPGVYEVSYVHIQDFAGNVRTIYNSPITNPELNIRDFSDKTITIYGQTEQITVESISISQQQLQPGNLVDLVMDINDDIIKPDQVTVYYTSELGQHKEVVMNLSDTTDYFGQLLIGEFEPSDSWRIDRIVFIDRFGSEFVTYNQMIYPNEVSVFDASFADFTVDNPEEGDLDAPQLNGVEVNKGTEDPNLINAYSPRLVSSLFRSVNTTTESSKAFYPNDIVEFKVDAVDDVSGVDRLLVTYLVGNSTVEFDVALVAQSDGTYIGRTRIKDYHPSGIWYVTKFILVDKAGNKYIKQTTDPTSGLTMFDHLRLTVERTTHDQFAPMLTNIQVTDKTLGKGDVLEILADASDDFSGVLKFEIIVSAKTISVERKITMFKTDSGQYVGQMSITDNIVADFWIIKSVELVDVAGNVRIIQNERLSNPNNHEIRNFDEQNFVVRGLASIQLISQPSRLKYHIGDSFDPTGLRVKAIYTDGSEEEIDFSSLVLHGYNNSVVNPKLSILVQYENRSTSFSINVYQRQPDQLVKLSEPAKISYFVDEAVDMSGLSLRLVYDDGVTKDLNADEWFIANPLVTSEAGQKQVIVQFANVTTTVNITVLKYSKSTPMQPEVDHVTDKTISLIEVSGQEYSMDGINWQISGLFEGLNPNQEYYVYARWMETRTHLASSSSLAAIVRTDRSLAATPLAPTLLYRSDLVIEVETMEGQLYSIDGINWQQGGIFDRLQPNTTYYVTTKTAVTQTTYESNVSEPLIVTTDLLNPPTPVAPTLKDKTTTSLEVFVVSGQEYSMDGLSWQDEGLFEGLLSYVEYSIYTRVKSTENNYVSGNSAPLIVYTLKSMISLEIIQQPSKLVYEQGDPINLSGLIVWGYFNDGSVENVTLTYVNIINPEVTLGEPGYYTVMMKYEDFTVTFDIEVIAKVEKQTPVQITKTDTMMVIVTPKGKIKVIMFDNNGRTEIDGE
ncbi:MAG: bacterial Ig-like domain-containing protein [Erysipelothrix sp.]|nr:bacterial Ig-like domain-containing protein [Erysipelothrix sp.]